MNPKEVPGSLNAPSVSDALLAVGMLLVALLSGVFVDAGRPDTVEPSRWWHWLLLCSPSMMVLMRRTFPVPAAIIATIAQVLIWVSDLPEFLLAIVVVLYTASALGGQVGVGVAAVSTLVLTGVTAIGLSAADDVSVYQVPLVALTGITAIALGVRSRLERETAAELASEMASIRARAEEERRTAVSDERIAIARELHDVIGHTLATIAVRAEAGSRVAENKPSEAITAIDAIAETARSSLDETRRVLAGLRTPSTAELSPAPDLSAVRSLVSEFRSSGANLEWSEEGCQSCEPPTAVIGGAYRIMQESLTNAVKHGGTGTVITASLVCHEKGLEITVANTAKVNSGSTAEAGYGLSGMAERARVLGGSFAVSQEDHRFVVKAELPFRVRSEP